MRVLGIDTSCDDTAAALVDAPRTILSNEVSSQHDLHAVFGGVIPEIASRAHTECVTRVVERALARAGVAPSAVEAVAVTNRPGLVGSLLVGVTAARSLALAWEVPLVGVHHIEAHCVAALAEHPHLDYPFVALVASGGHTALYNCQGPEAITCIGATVDDAAGECFDKVASLLGLPQPGGPAISRLASEGNPRAVRFPRPRVKNRPLDFSFAGLKTAVLYHLRGAGGRRGGANRTDLSTPPADVAASFEQAVVDVLIQRTLAAVEGVGARQLVIGGGVAANQRLRHDLRTRIPADVLAYFPSPALCTDNAAMVAIRGFELLRAGHRDGLDLDVRATGEEVL